MAKLASVLAAVVLLSAACGANAPSETATVAPNPTTTTTTTTTTTEVGERASDGLAYRADETTTTAATAIEEPDVTAASPQASALDELALEVFIDRNQQRRGQWEAPEIDRVTCEPLFADGPVIELVESGSQDVTCFPQHWWTSSSDPRFGELDQDQIDALGDSYETLAEIDDSEIASEELEPQPLTEGAEFYGVSVTAASIAVEDLLGLDPSVDSVPFDPSPYAIAQTGDLGLGCFQDPNIGEVCSVTLIHDVTEDNALAITVFGTDRTGIAQAEALDAKLTAILESINIDGNTELQ